jgi:hypothetical protein
MPDDDYGQTDGAPPSHFDQPGDGPGEADDTDYDPAQPLPEPDWTETTWQLLQDDPDVRKEGLNDMRLGYLAEPDWEVAARVIEHLQTLHGRKLGAKAQRVARRLPQEMQWMAPNLVGSYEAMRQFESERGQLPTGGSAPRPRPLREQVLDRRVSNRDALKAAFNDA